MHALTRRAYALENQFAHDQELLFKAEARRNRLIGLWVAAVTNKADPESYADDIKSFGIAHPDQVFERLRQDFETAGVTVLDDELRHRMATMLKEIADDLYRGG